MFNFRAFPVKARSYTEIRLSNQAMVTLLPYPCVTVIQSIVCNKKRELQFDNLKSPPQCDRHKGKHVWLAMTSMKGGSDEV